MKISELAEQTGLTTSAIRFYERSGLLPSPERGSNGYRSYSEIDVQRVYVIRIAQSLGFPLDSIRIFFDATPAGPRDGQDDCRAADPTQRSAHDARDADSQLGKRWLP